MSNRKKNWLFHGKRKLAVVISESSVRSDLLFDDEDGITCLTNAKFLENLALMGYEQTSVPQDLRADEAAIWRGDSVERAITTGLEWDTVSSPRTKTSHRVIIEDKGSGEKDGSTADQFSTARPDVSAATPTTTTIFDDDEDLTIAQTLVKMKSEKAKEKGVVLKDVEDNSRPVKSITTLQPLPTIDPKDKGKGILVEEPEKPEKVKRRDKGLAQIESDAKLAQRLYEEELAEVEKRQKERAKQEEASIAALYDDKQKPSKNPKVIKEQESTKSDKEAAEYYEQEKEELRMWLIVVPDEEETMDPEILSTKYPIVDWESQNLGREIHVYKIIRADGNTSYHKTFFSMLRKFDRQDLVDLHRLVMKRFEDNAPEGYNLFLWGDLKIMFEPNVKDVVWSN
ncbi:hypothetical protein Tco_0874657 [Tanacetum coccineum]|uniref:Uncharacterized protein n=1 Tax=Tanacetum coccineum TaxID=301880 RepID=A0ABQ5BM81_9ASTR